MTIAFNWLIGVHLTVNLIRNVEYFSNVCYSVKLSILYQPKVTFELVRTCLPVHPGFLAQYQVIVSQDLQHECKPKNPVHITISDEISLPEKIPQVHGPLFTLVLLKLLLCKARGTTAARIKTGIYTNQIMLKFCWIKSRYGCTVC